MSAMDVFWSWPPITRTMVAVSFTMSLFVHTNFLPFSWILYAPERVFHIPPELWRIPLSFLLTGPQMGIFFDPYFIYQYSSSLEKESPRFTELGSYFIYLVFNAVFILGLCGHYMGGMIFMSPLILALAYTFAQDNPERQTNFFIVTFSTKYLPYVLLFLTFVMAGPTAAKHQATGLLSAHFYDFLTRIWPQFGGGRNIVFTPNFVKRWFGAAEAGRPDIRDRGFGYSQGSAADAAPQGGWSNQRGPGRRLGG